MDSNETSTAETNNISIPEHDNETAGEDSNETDYRQGYDENRSAAPDANMSDWMLKLQGFEVGMLDVRCNCNLSW